MKGFHLGFRISFLLLIAFLALDVRANCQAATMTDYCAVPPFVTQSVPPLVMLTSGRDHKLYYTAYNDGYDLDGDGRLEIDYKHSIEYYGYFDPVKCYTYNSTNKRFDVFGYSAIATDPYGQATYGHQYSKFCASGQWSGNVLNWLAMTRMDVLRKVLYGGHRSTDTATSGATAGATVLERTYVPADSHSWAKELTGRLCQTTTPDATHPEFTTNCVTTQDCDPNLGYTECIDKSVNLIGIAAADQPTACSATVTVSNTSGKIFWARYNHSDAEANTVECGDDSTKLNTSYDPLQLITAAGGYGLGNDFNDTNITPDKNGIDHTNLMVVAEFNVITGKTGNWQFLLDSDDGAELLLINISSNTPILTTTGATIGPSTYGCHSACFLPVARDPNNYAPNAPPVPGWCNGVTPANTPNIVPATYNLNATGWYRLIVHHTNNSGPGGVRVWYKDPGAATWKLFGATNLASANLRAPNITASNQCSIMTSQFINTGLPSTGSVTAKRHLFCGTTDSVTKNSSTDTGVSDFVPGEPLLKLSTNSANRQWDWAAHELYQCDDTYVSPSPTAATKYSVRAQVCVQCDSTKAGYSCEDNCKKYMKTSTGDVTYKPTGLLQKYGEVAATQKVCSVGMSQLCSLDSQCAATSSGTCVTLKTCSRKFSKNCTQDSDCDTTKVCTTNDSLTCTQDSDCPASTSSSQFVTKGLCVARDGLCTDRVPMYFGLITDSFTKNMSGGVLRKDVRAITDEINQNDGTFIFTDQTQGNLIRSMERFRIVGYDYSTRSYSGNPPFGGTCNGGNSFTFPLAEGQCRDWGNPIGELMYEGLRYFADKGGPTSAFDTADTWISAKQTWGVPPQPAGTPTFQPYQIYPTCTTPYLLVLSDINPSYDSDQVPGSYFNTFTEDANPPTLNINVTKLTDKIGDAESISGNSWFIGQSGTSYDGMCTAKTVSKLSQARGLCPEEPSKQGSYYSAGLAYYGKTLMQYQLDSNMNIKTTGSGSSLRLLKSGIPNVTTYSVPVASPIPQIKIQLPGNQFITVVPQAKSISGDWGNSVPLYVSSVCWKNCTTHTFNADGLYLSGCNANVFCPTQAIVPLYVDSVKYDTNNNMIWGNFILNFKDSEQGSDQDKDSVVRYEICTQAAVNVYGTCATALNPNQIELKLVSQDASAAIQSVIGFVISGTTGTRVNGLPNDGAYLVVRQTDKNPPCDVCGPSSSSPPNAGLPLQWSKVFTASGNAAQLLKDPLWYAAKWGGFEDQNTPSDTPSLSTYQPAPDLQAEWNKSGSGIPDNYFLVVNPLRLQQQLDSALTSILRRAASGTAASVLASGTGSGANMIQAIFYPKKLFAAANTELSWLGTLQNYWYYLDPNFGNSSIFEDTDPSSSSYKKLEFGKDDVVKFFFDESDQTTKANRYLSNADGSMGAQQPTVHIEDLKNLWEAGLQLWNTAPSSRNIYTSCGIKSGVCNGSTGLMNFTTANKTAFTPYLNTSGDPESEAIIRYVRGEDTPFSPAVTGLAPAPNYRNRTTAIDLNKDGVISGSSEQPQVWKLGDIVNSTPQITSWIPLNRYHRDYGDNGTGSYLTFINSLNYLKRGTVVAGANDGMLHAFKLGLFKSIDDGSTTKAILCDDTNSDGVCESTETSTAGLGIERWAFIPKNSLPYLKYLADPNYCHIYSVDATPFIVDASLNIVSGCTETTDYWKCPKQTKCAANADCTGSGSTNTLDLANTSWRTILIGSMRLGGACKPTTYAGSNGVKAPITDPNDATKSFGYSSYFALDVTDENNPQLLWEFSDPALGFSTSGPAVVRIKNRTVTGSASTADSTVPGVSGGTNNGRWFVVLGSGPTGPIDNTQSFLGTSDQNLKVFILDMKGPISGSWTLNTNYWVKDTGITNAFAGSLVGGNADFDKDYQDDVVYFGYTQKDSVSGTWTKGGVLRLVTKEDLNGTNVSGTGDTALNPANWQMSAVIDNIGPVTAAVANLQFTPSGGSKPNASWLFFGTGRYFYKQDDAVSQRQIFGVKDQCFAKITGSYDLGTTLCGTTEKLALSDLNNSTINVHKTAEPPTLGTWKGWYINLESPANTATNNVEIGPCGSSSCMNTTSMAERIVTDPVAGVNGAVFFITFTPSADVCQYGGQSFLWGLKYDTGSSAAAQGLLQGKGNVQLSTGQIAEITLSTAFTTKLGKGDTSWDPGWNLQANGLETAGRRTGGIDGMPPTGRGLLVVVAPPPINSILHIRKR